MIKCDLATNSRNFEKLVQQPFLTCDGDYARGNWFNKKEEYLWVVRWRQIWWVLIRIGDKIRLITVLQPSLYKTQIKWIMRWIENGGKWTCCAFHQHHLLMVFSRLLWPQWQFFAVHHDFPFRWTLDSKSVQFIEYFLSDAFSMPFDIVQMSCGKRILSWNARARYAF